jgi:hypothetical protein
MSTGMHTDELRQSLDEETAVDQNGNAAYSHGNVRT